MNKKDLYFSDAENLYVSELLTISEIASRLSLGEKTVRTWRDLGGWESKRKKYLKSKTSFHKELYDFSRELMKSLREDLKSGEKTDPSRFYTFVRLLPMIVKVKEYEDIIEPKTQKAEAKGLSDEVVKMIEKQIFGINHEEPINEK